MDTNKILQTLKNTDDQRVKVGIIDIDGVLRGKILRKDKFLKVLDSSSGFCDVVFGWDMVDQAYDRSKVTGWHTGYPDANYTIDINTFRNIPWDENIPFFLGDFSSIDHPACPRSLLKKVIKKAENMGFKPIFAEEFEWFNFDETPESLNDKGGVNPKPLTPGMFGYSVIRASQKSDYFNDLFTLLEDFRIPIEGLHTETGPGVYEAAIQYCDILEAADRAALFKTAVKEIASKHGIMASFMAKWNMDLPGCSGHVHQSLWKDDKNLFADAKDKNKMSDIFKSYIAGQLKALPEILPMFAPTVNSYKRLVEGAWAPTTLTWGLDNRTTALRVLASGGSSTRLETRVPGSDVNPYLAMAAALAAGIYGIEQKLELSINPTNGNGYEDKSNGILPADLKSATEQMRSSSLAKTLFGEEFVDHFCMTREWEHRQFASSVTDWEIKRYFEII
ncbi:MAG: glutamine synthetase [Flammeovirgaceae bacterium]|nr:glutamine synthetase [Flammeovirgaceae bacterium]MBE62542.1 glutamine synthetase [Flammeovirgaceae bacterium]MBR08995.1 glutamine synthetase [Rickettsiales bacterium]|tara:strand:+ start:6008 stop:7351 length:1344 start_codon:yes stop_codon:yes gene_type:complete